MEIDKNYVSRTRPGARGPHAWLEDGRSTLDLFGAGFTLPVLDADADKSVSTLRMSCRFRSTGKARRDPFQRTKSPPFQTLAASLPLREISAVMILHAHRVHVLGQGQILDIFKRIALCFAKFSCTGLGRFKSNRHGIFQKQ